MINPVKYSAQQRWHPRSKTNAWKNLVSISEITASLLITSVQVSASVKGRWRGSRVLPASGGTTSCVAACARRTVPGTSL